MGWVSFGALNEAGLDCLRLAASDPLRPVTERHPKGRFQRYNGRARSQLMTRTQAERLLEDFLASLGHIHRSSRIGRDHGARRESHIELLSRIRTVECAPTAKCHYDRFV